MTPRAPLAKNTRAGPGDVLLAVPAHTRARDFRLPAPGATIARAPGADGVCRVKDPLNDLLRGLARIQKAEREELARRLRRFGPRPTAAHVREARRAMRKEAKRAKQRRQLDQLSPEARAKALRLLEEG